MKVPTMPPKGKGILCPVCYFIHFSSLSFVLFGRWEQSQESNRFWVQHPLLYGMTGRVYPTRDPVLSSSALAAGDIRVTRGIRGTRGVKEGDFALVRRV